jgi:hypothetical protein
MPANKMAIPRQVRVGLMKAGEAFLLRNNYGGALSIF